MDRSHLHEHIHQGNVKRRALRLLSEELESLCDKLEKGTHMETKHRLLLIQSISSCLSALKEHTDEQ